MKQKSLCDVLFAMLAVNNKRFLINVTLRTVFCFRLLAPLRLCHLVSRDLLNKTYRGSLFLCQTRLKFVAQVEKPNYQ